VPAPRLLLPLVLATCFGALNAVLAVSARPAAEFVGQLLNAGWAWAGLAVLAGALVREPLLGAVAGVLSAGSALFAFDAVDALLREVSLVDALSADRLWWAAGLLFCPGLGVVGTQVRRPGTLGLLARLVVPTGAALEAGVRLDGQGVRWTVWTAAAAVSLTLLTHHRRAVRESGGRAASGRSPHRRPHRSRR
jgi:hypothetical protein